MIEFVQPTEAHVAELAAHMRQADRDELRAAGLTDCRKSLNDSLAVSSHMATILIDGRVAAIFGLVPLSLLGGTAAPWLLGTDLVVVHRRALMRRAPPYIAQMLRIYPHLFNWVYMGNGLAVRWLRRAGFDLHPPTPHPLTGEPFRRFEMKARYV